MKKIIPALVLMTALHEPAFAQDVPTVEDQFSEKVSTDDRDKVVTMVVENDLFGTKGTDANYTSGVRFTFLDVNADLPYLSEKLDDVIPTFEINNTTSVYYSIGHNLYTPRDIKRRSLDVNDRPWASHIYGSMGLFSITDNHLDEVEVSLGVIGPAALGKPIQRFVHEYISGSPEPKGWKNQLKNEPTLGVSWVRRYPLSNTIDVLGLSVGGAPHFGATLGNARTFANAGFNIRLTPESEKWQDTPVRVRPALPGTGLFETPKNKRLSWYVFAGLDGRAVARDIFLDGNTFTDSHSVDKKHFVADANAGVAFTYDNVRMSYTLVYRTKEFHKQDDEAVFGAISLGYRF